MANVKADLSGLQNLVKSLKDEHVLRVGILGKDAQKGHDNESGLTNGEVGAFHEFGTRRMPRRSFLEDALIRKLNFNNPKMQDLQKTLWKQVFVKNATKNFLLELGSLALDAVWQAFDTNGFGEWKPLTTRTENQFSKARKRNNKKNGYQILTDTGRLRHSISFKVIKKGG